MPEGICAEGNGLKLPWQWCSLRLPYVLSWMIHSRIYEEQCSSLMPSASQTAKKTHNIPVDKLHVFKVQYDLSASLHLFLQLLDVFRLNSTTIKG
jgi:hypothetical protein